MSENNIQQIPENTAKQLYNLNAEQALLGGILLNNEYLNRVNEFLLPEHFYEPNHQKIYAYILDTIQKNWHRC